MTGRRPSSHEHYTEQVRSGFLGLKFNPALEKRFLTVNLFRRRMMLSLFWGAFLFYQILLLTLDFSMIESGTLLSHLLIRTLLAILPVVGVIAVTLRSRSPIRVHATQAAAMVLVGGATLLFASQTSESHSFQAVLRLLFYLAFLFLLSGIPFRLTLLISVVMIFGAGLIEIFSDQTTLLLIDNTVFWFFCFFSLGLLHLYYREYTVRWEFLKSSRMRGHMERDSETNLYSRSSFETHLERVWRQAMRDRLPIALVMLDSEEMAELIKSDDEEGDTSAELLMRAVAEVLNSVQKRPLDMVARLDTSRFVVLWYGAHPEMVRMMAGSLKKKMAELMVQPFASHETHPLSIDIGVAVTVPERGDDEYDFLNLANEALLLATQESSGNVVIRHFDRSWPW